MIVFHLLIDVTGNNEFGRGEGYGIEINLSNLSAFKKSIGVGYLTFKSAKKGDGNLNSGGGNIKKNVKAARGFNYLISGNKKVFNLLWYAFT